MNVGLPFLAAKPAYYAARKVPVLNSGVVDLGSAVLPNSVSRSTSCGIRAKPYRRPKERCPQRTILV